MSFVNLAENLFNPSIPESAQIVLVSDAFLIDYKGGAELTTEALIESSPFEVHQVKSGDVTMSLLEKGHKKYWIFGNYANLDRKLIPTIVANLNYSIIEYDFKYCRYRSPEKHKEIERTECNCQNDECGKIVSAFMYGAKSLFWMSEMQQEQYMKLFPFLRTKNNLVISSVFSDSSLTLIKTLRTKNQHEKKKNWAIIGSPSWIKGTDDAKKHCEERSMSYDVYWDESHDEFLNKLSLSEGLVFLPKGGDTCPRVVIEAKLLGLKLVLNQNVMHKDELWFDTDDLLEIESYLYANREWFWNSIKIDMEYEPKVSGYTTTRNCIEQDYPYEECIRSMLGFCDEVVVVDGGSTDGTWERLVEMSGDDSKLRVYQHRRDWNHKRFAVFDGQQKALARSLCTMDFCWQQDSDEVVHEQDYVKVRNMVKHIPKHVPMIALPVIEYWGGTKKVRFDINPWKWRLSGNLPFITHGIPSIFRRFDVKGDLYAGTGTDGCDLIRFDDYQPIPFANFFTPDVEQLRKMSLHDEAARLNFQKWFNMSVKSLPSVHHFSWFNIKRKMMTYKDYWSRHWQSLYNIVQEDIPDNNMFFDKPWSLVREDEINDLAQRLADEMGGWIFHEKIDFSRRTPHIECDVEAPALMKDWIAKNEKN